MLAPVKIANVLDSEKNNKTKKMTYLSCLFIQFTVILYIFVIIFSGLDCVVFKWNSILAYCYWWQKSTLLLPPLVFFGGQEP